MRVVIAYLDPGTGSLVVQAVLGGVAGAVVFFKVMGRRVLRRGRPAEPARSGRRRCGGLRAEGRRRRRLISPVP